MISVPSLVRGEEAVERGEAAAAAAASKAKSSAQRKALFILTAMSVVALNRQAHRNTGAVAVTFNR
jgi:hypothetical protein